MKTKRTFRYDLFLASHLTHGKKRLTNIIKAAFRSPWMPVSPGTARNDLLLSVNVSFYFWESKREKETRLFPSMEPFCQTIFRDTVVLKNIVEPLFLLYTLFTLSYSNAPLHNLLFLIPFFALILWFHSLTLSLSLRHLPVYCSIFHLLLPVSQPPFIAFLSSPHQRQDPAVNLLKHSHPPSFSSQSWRERVQEDRETGGGRHWMLVCRGGEQKIHDNKKDKRTQNGPRHRRWWGVKQTLMEVLKEWWKGRESEEGR